VVEAYEIGGRVSMNRTLNDLLAEQLSVGDADEFLIGTLDMPEIGQPDIYGMNEDQAVIEEEKERKRKEEEGRKRWRELQEEGRKNEEKKRLDQERKVREWESEIEERER